MKKTLIVSVILGISSLALAQDTSTTTTTTQQQNNTTTDQNTNTTDQTNTTTTDQNTTTTTDTTTTQSTDTTATSDLSAEELYARAQEQAAQAEVAYPVAFLDRTLWKAAVSDASMAAMMDANNRAYKSYQAQLYTKTQWWINAYNAWSSLGDLTEAERDLAALSAAKLAYLAIQRGDQANARTYVTQGLQWRQTQSLQQLQTRLQ
ncbi:hypothetical protein [Deinococcus pimensis]|uniref:hypothetical protein n=1 Tax=Deinococcus pimensis TaxID=309888 RepID=UPI0004822874|nr:hypothetical protein [Deinococcus pimensis]